MKIAAVLVIGFLLSTAVVKYNMPKAQIQKIHISPGQRVEFDLSDGTKKWLNSGSTLTFPSYFAVDDTHKVTLER